MDLRLGPESRARIRLNPEANLRVLMEQAPKAEAVAAHYIEKTRPGWTWLAKEWRRLGTAAAVALAIALLIHSMFGINGMVAYRQKRLEMKDLQTEIDRLQKENDNYVVRIKALKTDPKAIEKEAREQLHYAKQGEVIYVSPDPPPKPPVGRAKSDSK